jgi:adenosylhomocysteine nucleosidase
MTIALLSAMAPELARYREVCGEDGCTEKAGLTLHHTAYAGHRLTMVAMGVGKVNAAMATQVVVDTVAPDVVLCTGTAGALHDGLEVGDLVVAEECLQHDLRVAFLGLPPGQIPFTDHRVFASDLDWVHRAMAVDLPDHSIRRGRVLTGDAFVQDPAARSALHEELDGDCVEMEGAAVGQVCTLNAVPFLIVRAISDHADGQSDVDFQAFLDEAAEASAQLVLRMIQDET